MRTHPSSLYLVAFYQISAFYRTKIADWLVGGGGGGGEMQNRRGRKKRGKKTRGVSMQCIEWRWLDGFSRQFGESGMDMEWGFREYVRMSGIYMCIHLKLSRAYLPFSFNSSFSSSSSFIPHAELQFQIPNSNECASVPTFMCIFYRLSLCSSVAVLWPFIFSLYVIERKREGEWPSRLSLSLKAKK